MIEAIFVVFKLEDPSKYGPYVMLILYQCYSNVTIVAVLIIDIVIINMMKSQYPCDLEHLKNQRVFVSVKM